MSRLASPGGRLGRAARVTSALVVAGLCLTGCAQTPKPTGLSHSVLYANAPASIVWCLLHRHIIPLRDVRSQPWFKNGRMKNDAALTKWLGDNALTKTYAGTTLEDWVIQARQQWPTSLCGPEPTTFPSTPVYPSASPSP